MLKHKRAITSERCQALTEKQTVCEKLYNISYEVLASNSELEASKRYATAF